MKKEHLVSVFFFRIMESANLKGLLDVGALLFCIAVNLCCVSVSNAGEMPYCLPFDNGSVATLANYGTVGGSGTAVTVSGSTPTASTVVYGGLGGSHSENFPMASGGISGGRVELPSSTDKLRLNNSGDEMTVSLWLKWNGPDSSSSSYQGIVSTLPSSQNSGWCFMINSGGNLGFNMGGIGSRITSTTVGQNTWTHCAMTWKSGNPSTDSLKIYINGQIAGTSSIGPVCLLSNTQPIRLGNFDGTYLPVNGALDDVGLWNYRLNDGMIRALVTVPAFMSGYDADIMNQLFALFNAADGSQSLDINGLRWHYSSILPSGHSAGDVWGDGAFNFIQLGTGPTGVCSNPIPQVFAHYMVCYNDYNSSLDGYKHDVMDAKSYGIDGFALNMGAWATAPHFKTSVSYLFQAAQEIGGFKLFFSADMVGDSLTAADILDMMDKYANHPAYYKVGTRPFLSTFSGQGELLPGATYADTWWQSQVLEPLAQNGTTVYFVPYFYPSNYDVTPYFSVLLQEYNNWWKNVCNGYYYFGTCGLPSYGGDRSILQSGEDCADLFHDNARAYMAPVSLSYWGDSQVANGRVYWEYEGGKGLSAQWDSIISNQKPEWIELFTWNDFGEHTYFSPIDDVQKYWPAFPQPLGYYLTHAGIAPLMKYYISWYKSGYQPEIKTEHLIAFYRTHPKDAIALDDSRGPVSNRMGPIEDCIYVTTMLKNPGTLSVITGGVTKEYSVSSGIVHTSVPFNTGAQTFSLKRGSSTVMSVNGISIDSIITLYNFGYHIVSVSNSGEMPYCLPFDNGGVATLANYGTVGGSGTAVTVSGSTPAASTVVYGGLGGSHSENFPMASGGISGGRVELPSSTDKLRLNNSGDEMTVSLWLKWNGPDSSSSSYQGIVSTLPASQNSGWSFMINSGGNLGFNMGGIGSRITSSTVGQNTWTHCAMTWKSGNPSNDSLKIYINGQIAGTSSIGPVCLLSNTQPIRLGNFDGTYLPVNGALDDVGLWNYRLNDGMIRALVTVPAFMSGYDADIMNQLFALFNAADGSQSLDINGLRWHYSSSLPSGHSAGDVWGDGAFNFIQLGTGSTGVCSTLIP